MALTPTFYAVQSAHGRGNVSAAFVTAGVNLPANALIVVIALAVGNSNVSIGGTSMKCAPSSGGPALTQLLGSAGSSTWMYGGAVFTGQTTTATTGTTFSLTYDNGTLQGINTWDVQIIAFTGYDTTTPTFGSVQGTSASGTGAGSLTLTTAPASGDYVLGAVCSLCNDVGAITVTQGSGFTEQCDTYDDDSGHFEVEYRTGSTSTTVAWVQLGTPSGTALEAKLFAVGIKAAAGGGGTTYNVSVSESGSAAGSPSAAGGSGVSVLESGSAANTQDATKLAPATQAESSTAADTVTQGTPASIAVALKQYWLKPWLTTSQASLQSGTNPFTPSTGATLVALTAGWDSQRQIPLPTSTGGTFSIPSDGTDSSLLHPNQMTIDFSCMANASGAQTITPPTILDGTNNGDQGEVGVWVIEVTGMPATLSVRDVTVQYNSSTSKTWSVTSASTVKAGDLILVSGTYENTATAPDAALTTPTGFTQISVNNDASTFIPTELAYKIATADGAVTASWTTIDNNKNQDLSLMLVLTPSTSGAGSSTSASVTETGTATATHSATESTSAIAAEVGAAASTASATESTSATVGETAAGADVVSGSKGMTAVQADAGTASDTTSSNATNGASLSENGAAADTQSASATVSASQLEAAAGAETSNASASNAQSMAEVGSASDTMSSAAVLGSAVSEQGAAADHPSNVVATSAAMSETGTASEQASQGSTTAVSVTESGAANESISALNFIGVLINDALTAADSTGASALYVAQALESGTVDDLASAAAVLGAALADFETATDQSGTVQNLFLDIVEGLNAVDAPNWVDIALSLLRLYQFQTDSRHYAFPSDGARSHSFSFDARVAAFAADTRRFIFPGDPT